MVLVRVLGVLGPWGRIEVVYLGRGFDAGKKTGEKCGKAFCE